MLGATRNLTDVDSFLYTEYSEISRRGVSFVPELSNDYQRLSNSARDFLFHSHGMLIDGQMVGAKSGAELSVIDPTNLKTVGQVPSAAEADVNLAVAAAQRALETGAWSGATSGTRERLILKLAELVERDRTLFAEIEAVESGRTLGNTLAFDSDLSVSCLRYMAGWATKISGKTIDLTVPYAPGMKFFAYTLMQPIGVVAAITPWNVPLIQAVWKIAPALAAGCTVVLKPSELTPLGAIRLGELIVEAGFPAGVVNILTGTGREAGAALVKHPGVNKISFTGSTAVGRQIAQVGAAGLKKVTLELGGKSPMVILEDAALENAIPGAAMGIYANHGQNCCAGSRLYVHESIFDKVVAGISQIARQTALGSSLDPDTQMGPLVSKAQQERVLQYIHSGVSEGAELVVGGTAPDHVGAYVAPAILTQVRQDMAVVREEIFGPVLVATPFKTEEEALRLANDTSYGLGASIWTRDFNKIQHFTRRFRAGTVWVNIHNVLDMALPFGGVKDSGIGHDLGEEAVLQNCQIKASIVNIT
jgi:phenylacetaldehyde dehydrogenase